jgi:prevent-host-death family protein
MITVSVSVTEAARNFADCVNQARYQGTTFVLHKNGTPVARIVPEELKRGTVWRQLVFPTVLPQEEMLPENFVCFGPKFDVDRDEIVSSVSTFLQDTYRGW